MWLFTFFYFLFFLVFFSMFCFCLLLCKETFKWLASFSMFVFIFKESTLQYLKKIQVQIIAFKKKTVVKVSKIPNSNSPLWNLVKFRCKFFLVNVLRLVCRIFFKFWLWINGKTIKAHLHICSICLRLDVSSLTKSQYL